MGLGKNEVNYVANLARIEIKEDEIDKFANQLSDILKYVEKLNEVDTENIEPMAHAVDIPTPLREDKVKNPSGKENALSNAPEKDGDYFKVPKII